MKTKETIISLSNKHLKGELNEQETTEFIEWLNASHENLKKFNEIKEAVESTQADLIKEELDLDKIYQQITKKASSKNTKSRRINSFIKVAASIAILISTGIVVNQFILKSDSTEEILVHKAQNPYIITPKGEKVIIDAEKKSIKFDELLSTNRTGKSDLNERKKSQINELVVPQGCRINLELADGSHVWLNSESRLFYPSIFTGKKRTVKLIGEGYFEITKSKEYPFIVETEKLNIEVLGTTFNVSAFENDSYISTTLVEGKVKVISQETQQEIFLQPNQQAFFDKTTQRIEIKKVDTELYTSWINGYYTFQSESLEIILQKLTRSYGIPIQLSGSELSSCKFSGKLDLKENLEDVLEVIGMMIPIKVEAYESKVIIQKSEE